MTLQLRHLSLRNVRSYESAELDLGPGVTVLVGDVGSGKTSLLHAIEMALFGFAEVEAPYLVRHRTGAASVALTLSDGEHSYELARAFRRRTRRGREVFEPEEPTFRMDGELRTYSATEFRQRVIELLGFPDNPNPRSRSDLWRWAVYTPQERMREILREDETDARLETIRKALGLQRYRLAADNAELLATVLRARARTHADVARGLQHFESDLATAESDVAVTGAAVQEAEAVAAQSRRQSAEAEELLSASEAGRRAREADQRELEHRVEEQSRLERSLPVTERRATDARAEVARKAEELAALDRQRSAFSESRRAAEVAEAQFRAARVEFDRVEVAVKVFAGAEAEVRSARTALEEFDRGLDRDREELARARAEAESAARSGPPREPVAPTPRTLEEITAAIAAVRQEEGGALRELHGRESELRELTTLIDGKVCPRCHQAVHPADFASHRAEAERAAATATTVVAALGERIASTEAERASRERFERTHQSWRASEDLREQAHLAESRALARVDLASSARAERVARVDAAVEAEARARGAAEPVARAREEVARTETRRDATRSAVAELERHLATADALRDAVVAAKAHASAEDDRLTADRQRWHEVHAAVERLRHALQGAVEANRAHADLLARRDAARTLERTAIGAATAARERHAFADERRSTAAEGVSERRTHVDRAGQLQEMATFVASPFHDGLLDLERRRLGRAQATFERSFSRAFATLVEDPGLLARCGPSFVPFVEIDGEWTPAEALSGGERTALALAFRVALGDVVRESGRLRLDTIVLDEPTDGFSPEQVARMGELLRSLPWGQVLVVTHEASLAGVADRTVRVRKDGGTSLLDGETNRPLPLPPLGAKARRRKLPSVDEVAPPAT